MRSTIRIVTHRTPGVPEGRRSYRDLVGPRLTSHVLKHVLNREEGWASALGLDLEKLSDATRGGREVLEASTQLENALDALAVYGDAAEAVLLALVCEPELEKLDTVSPGWRRVGRSLANRDGTTTTGDPLVDAALSTGASLKSANAFARDRQVSEMERYVVKAVPLAVRAAEAMASVAPPTWVRQMMERLRREMEREPGLGPFVSAWLARREDANERVQAAFGGRFQLVAAGYLAEAHEAADVAGGTPRHCRYDRGAGAFKTVGIEAYLDDHGTVVCVGPGARRGDRVLYTAHRPTEGQGPGEKTLLATNDELLRTLTTAPGARRRLFLADLARMAKQGQLEELSIHDHARWLQT